MLDQTPAERKNSLTEAERQTRANLEFQDLLKDTYCIDNSDLVSKVIIKTNDRTGNIVVSPLLEFDHKLDCFVLHVHVVLYTVDEDGDSKESAGDDAHVLMINPTQEDVLKMVEHYKSFTDVQAPEPTEEHDEHYW